MEGRKQTLENSCTRPDDCAREQCFSHTWFSFQIHKHVCSLNFFIRIKFTITLNGISFPSFCCCVKQYWRTLHLYADIISSKSLTLQLMTFISCCLFTEFFIQNYLLQMDATRSDATSTPHVKRTNWAEPNASVPKLAARYFFKKVIHCVSLSWYLYVFRSQLANAEVCGTDGITYRNECELKLAACRNQQFIVVASKGDCGLF